MLISATSPRDEAGEFDCQDDGTFALKGAEFSLKDMAEDLQRVRLNSPLGLVNSIDNPYHLVLRSLETVGWEVNWPDVEVNEDDDTDYAVDELAAPDVN